MDSTECIWEMAVDALQEEFVLSMFTMSGVKEEFTIPREEAEKLRDGLTMGLNVMTMKES